MAHESLQVLLHYSQCVGDGKCDVLSHSLSRKVGENLIYPDIAMGFSRVSEVVDLELIQPTSELEILALPESDIDNLLSILTPVQWELLDQVLQDFLPKEDCLTP